MTRRPVQLNEAREIELMRSTDALDRDLVALMQKHGYSDRVRERLAEVESELWGPPPKIASAVGAPKRWGDAGDFYAYIAIESELRAAKRKDRAAGLRSVVGQKIKRRPWRILQDRTGGKQHLELTSVAGASRRYYAGRKLVQTNPVLGRLAALVLGQLLKNSPAKT